MHKSGHKTPITIIIFPCYSFITVVRVSEDPGESHDGEKSTIVEDRRISLTEGGPTRSDLSVIPKNSSVIKTHVDISVPQKRQISPKRSMIVATDTSLVGPFAICYFI